MEFEWIVREDRRGVAAMTEEQAVAIKLSAIL
jgi:hypothetical protein